MTWRRWKRVLHINKDREDCGAVKARVGDVTMFMDEKPAGNLYKFLISSL